MDDRYSRRDLGAGDIEWRTDHDRAWKGPRSGAERRAFGGPGDREGDDRSHPRHHGYRLGSYGHSGEFGAPDYIQPGQGYGGAIYENAPYQRGYGEDMTYEAAGRASPTRRGYGEAYPDRYGDQRAFQGGNERLQRVSDGDADRGHLFGGGTDSHRGRGPKGYKRSDSRIHDDVADSLSADHWLDASDIEVAVQDGEVTLSGQVQRRDDRRRAEDLAERVLGVEHVQNNLRVSDPSTTANAALR